MQNSPSPVASRVRPVFIVRPTHKHELLDLRELCQYRHLFAVFVWRILKVRYQQTAIGVGWAVLQPLLLMAVFSVIFGVLAKLPTEGTPYPLFVMSGLVVWQFVAQSFQNATVSVVMNAPLVTRIYFPRILLPASTIAASLVDLACGLVLLVGLMLWYGVEPGIGLVFFPAALVLAVATVLGLSLWLGSLYVPYRDIGHLLPFLIQVWMFASPIIYPLSLLPETFQLLYAINPLVVVIETSRWAFTGSSAPDVAMVAVSACVATAMLVSGLWFFRRHEGTFADIV